MCFIEMIFLASVANERLARQDVTFPPSNSVGKIASILGKIAPTSSVSKKDILIIQEIVNKTNFNLTSDRFLANIDSWDGKNDFGSRCDFQVMGASIGLICTAADFLNYRFQYCPFIFCIMPPKLYKKGWILSQSYVSRQWPWKMDSKGSLILQDLQRCRVTEAITANTEATFFSSSWNEYKVLKATAFEL